METSSTSRIREVCSGWRCQWTVIIVCLDAGLVFLPVQASVQYNTYAVSGNAETKSAFRIAVVLLR
jgi:hypothetical protein